MLTKEFNIEASYEVLEHTLRSFEKWNASITQDHYTDEFLVDMGALEFRLNNLSNSLRQKREAAMNKRLMGDDYEI